MYDKDHPEFKLPIGDPKTITIWRFMDYSKFEDLVSSNTLYFPSLASMVDEHEGLIPEGFAEKWIEFEKAKNGKDSAKGVRKLVDGLKYFKKSIFISCWSIAEEESYAMWRLYTKDKRAVGIKSTVQRLIDSFENEKNTQFIGAVAYHDGKNYSFNSNGLGPVMYKWNYYRFESELRVVGHHNFSYKNLPTFIRPEIITDKLIHQIYLHPHAEEDEHELIKQLLEANNLQKDIIKSGIREKW